MEKQNIKIVLEYDGERYHGWQRQLKALTIQETIETALMRIFRKEVSLIGSGRTDAGVHAQGQVANFKIKSKLPLKNLQAALNSYLPKDIIVKSISRVPDDFHACYRALSKLYRYTIFNASSSSPLARKYVYFVPVALDIKAMQRGAKFLLGKHDFSSFQASGGKKGSTIRRIKKLRILNEGNYIYLDIEADGFLYNMVRIISGTLLEVGKGKMLPCEMGKILGFKDRKKAGPTLPPQGLSLLKVKYR